MKKSSLRSRVNSNLRAGALALALFPFLAFASPAQVRFEGRKVTASADSQHKPLAQAVYISESEDCSARVTSSREIEVPENCGYLRGLYRYVVLPEGETSRKQIFVGFAVHHASKGARTLLVNPAVELDETMFAP